MKKKTLFLGLIFIFLLVSIVQAGYYNSNPNHKVCDSGGCEVTQEYPRCWINHYWSKDNDDPTVTDILLHRAVDESSFEKSCGAEQIDVACTVGGEFIGYYAGTWKRYDHDCGSEPEPEPKVCGDGKVNQASEECDEGSNNGNVPDPDWNEELTYCTNSCKIEKIKGPVCQDECSLGDTMCKPGEDLWQCGDFDSDPCLEWGFKKSCDFTHESNTYYICQEDDSVGYKDIETGFCNDKQGYNDFCSSTAESVKVDENDCGITTCSDEEFCKNDDIYSKTECTVRGCNMPTGQCKQPEETTKVNFEKDCGSDSISDPFCDGEKIVEIETFRGCEETTYGASCFEDQGTNVIQECGPDICISHTDLDPEVFEYVEDLNSCEENGYPFCAAPSEPTDMCLNEDILLQPFCDGKDHKFEEFNCNTKDGCYPYETQIETTCLDSYSMNCKKKIKNITGQEFRDYQCGSGVCKYTVSTEDIDEDKIDDRCDDCIDVDKDGICDDVDNCPAVWNGNQVDTDNDGKGNMCDNDRDNDGYPADLDCDDWNPEVNPGAEEIPNNNRDDDCNPNTEDRVANKPRELLYVDIQTTDEKNIVPGGDLFVLVRVMNQGEKDLDNIHISVSMPGHQLYRRKLQRTLDGGESISRIFEFTLPEDLKTRYEYLRVSISNDEYKRTIYREIKVNTEE